MKPLILCKNQECLSAIEQELTKADYEAWKDTDPKVFDILFRGQQPQFLKESCSVVIDEQDLCKSVSYVVSHNGVLWTNDVSYVVEIVRKYLISELRKEQIRIK